MKFARWVFAASGIYGLIIIIPMYFSEYQIGQSFPPPITHPEYFYGFLGVTLAWQILFLLIAINPLRYRLMMIPAIIEKFAYGSAIIVLFAQERIAVMMLSAGIIDTVLGLLFIITFFKTKEEIKHEEPKEVMPENGEVNNDI